MQISCPVNSTLGIFSKKAKNAQHTLHNTIYVLVVEEVTSHQRQDRGPTFGKLDLRRKEEKVLI